MLIVVTGVGCSFHGTASTIDETPVDATPVTIDAAVVPDAPPAATVVPCATPDTSGLVACYEFEDGVADGTLLDSSPNHFDAITSGLAPTMRGSSHAAMIGASSMTYSPSTAAFDRAAGYTMSMWVNPTTLPADGEVYGLLDHELQYAMAIVTTGGVPENRCIHTGGTEFEQTSNLPTNAWSLLACTWDGNELCAVRWTSATDHERNCFQPEDLPASTGAHGLAIGHLSTSGTAHDHFDGAVDSIHVFDHALTANQLCASAGQGSGCLPCDQCD